MAGIIVTTPGSDTLGVTNTVPHFVPQYWADEVLEAAEFATVVVGRCDDWSDEIPDGDIVTTPMLSNIDQTNIPNDGTDISFSNPQEDKQALTVDQQKVVAIHVGSIVEVQARMNVRQKYTKKMGYTLARGKDVFMSGKFDLASTTVGTLGVELTSDDYGTVWQKLQEAGIVADNDPDDEFSLFLSPAAYAAALKVDVFANRQYNPAGNAIQRANIGDIYGLKVYLSNLLESDAAGQHDCAAFHRSAYAFAAQRDYVLESDRLVQKVSDVVAAWTIYGGTDVLFPPETPITGGTYTATDNRAIYVRTV